jgi:hypothetical protein
MEQARARQTGRSIRFTRLCSGALYVKMRHEGRVENRAVYVAIGINLEGRKDVLGLWTGAWEGAKFWLSVLMELRNRGVKDIYLACVDGLKGFPQAIESVFPKAQVQLCIVHMIRASLHYVTWKDRKEVVSDLKPIYKAATDDEAERQLSEFEEKWKKKYPAISRLWREHWERVIPFFAFRRRCERSSHHQRRGVAAHEPAQDHQNARVVSHRRSRIQAALSGASACGGEMGDGAALETDAQLFGHDVRRPNRRQRRTEINPSNSSEPTSRMSRSPHRSRPSKFPCITERCSRARVRSAAPKRRALAPSAPFCQDGFATGGSGGMS